MYEIRKKTGDFTKTRKLLWRTVIIIAKSVFREEGKFIYFLKSIGRSDAFCVNALGLAYGLESNTAKILLSKFIAAPFTEPKH